MIAMDVQGSKKDSEVRKSCGVCPRRCSLGEGDIGLCHARAMVDGEIRCRNYGILTSLALDPIEKKPLYRFYPGSMILSLGSFGCNLYCEFCQNYEISQSDGIYEGNVAGTEPEKVLLSKREFTAAELAEIAVRAKEEDGSIGLAFTYNEPLVGYEFVKDTASRTHELGLKNVLVTNGCAEISILEELLPYIDAMNIDLKCFTDEGYRKLGGDLDTVKAFIKRAYRDSHIELTTLVVPDISDSLDDFKREIRWISDLDPEIPLHLTRYFPRYKYKKPSTSIELLRLMEKTARESLRYVFVGNI